MALKPSHSHLVAGTLKIVYDTRIYTVPGLGKITCQRDEAGTQCYDESGNAVATPGFITNALATQPMAAPIFR